uniref:Uncharacterized protein n=1 Tax=Megaselia scalaris TaxID=36166 RepID=T1GZZ5_MEGSC
MGWTCAGNGRECPGKNNVSLQTGRDIKRKKGRPRTKWSDVSYTQLANNSKKPCNMEGSKDQAESNSRLVISEKVQKLQYCLSSRMINVVNPWSNSVRRRVPL